MFMYVLQLKTQLMVTFYAAFTTDQVDRGHLTPEEGKFKELCQLRLSIAHSSVSTTLTVFWVGTISAQKKSHFSPNFPPA